MSTSLIRLSAVYLILMVSLAIAWLLVGKIPGTARPSAMAFSLQPVASSQRWFLTATDLTERQGWAVPADQAHARSVAFSSFGNQLAVSGPGRVLILDADNGEQRLSHDQNLSSTNEGNAAIFSNDGKMIASGMGEKVVELWDATSGKPVRQFAIPSQKGEAIGPSGRIISIELGINPLVGAFSPDGSLLAVQAGHRCLLFDTVTGKACFSLPLTGGENGGMPENRVVLALNGAVLATARLSKTIFLWNVKTGEKIRELSSLEGSVMALSISPDGRTLASCTGFWDQRISYIIGFDYGDHIIQLWDMPTGRSLLTIKGHADNVRSVVYSSDGRSLVSGGDDKTIRLWETATGKEMLRWNMGEQVNKTAISPDGKKIGASLVGGGVICFPIDSNEPDKSLPPVNDKFFDHLWTDIAGADVAQAYRTVRTLSEADDDIPARIAKRLERTDPIALWLADLDNDSFARREAASKQLASYGAPAEPALRKALAETQSAEVRSRIQALLKEIDAYVVTDPDLLRSLRAIWVLERIGTPEALVVLGDLAKGAPEARQTQEAKAALDFLDKRAAATKP